MTYVSGARTSQANPAEDLYALIATELTAHPNWDFVEDYTISTTKWSVWRCGTLSSLGANYYIMFGRSTAAGVTDLYVGVSEGYDTATHTYTRGIPPSTTSSTTPAADGSYGGATTYALTASVGTQSSQHREVLYTSTTAYDYWIAVNNDALMVTVKNPNQYGVLVSPFDSLVANPATNDPMPLLSARVQSTTNDYYSAVATASRHPLVTTSQPRLFAVSSLAQARAWPDVALAGSVGGTGDLFQAGKPVGARMALTTWASEQGVAINAAGKTRGLYRHVLVLQPASGVVLGDTCVVGTDTYVYLGFTNAWYNTSVA